jgi:hypothetical protein
VKFEGGVLSAQEGIVEIREEELAGGLALLEQLGIIPRPQSLSPPEEGGDGHGSPIDQLNPK